MYNILAFITLLLSCYFLLRILRPVGTAEGVLIFFCLFTAHIVTLGYILSFINHLGDVRYWSMLGLITALISAVVTLWNGQSIALPRFEVASLMHTVVSIKNGYTKELSRFEKLLLAPLILTTLLLGVLNLISIVFAAPHNWDSMTYHLARVAYYLQYNNMNYFAADYWAQVIHPKNSSLLLLYTYLISGQKENLTQIVQFISYWVAVCAVYAISTKVGNSKPQSIFAATVSALLTEWLMQSTTTQNDLILTAYFGTIVYFLLAFREMNNRKYLMLASLGIGLSIGTKASSFLPLASVALVALYALFQFRAKPSSQLRNSAVLAVSVLLAICVFALPAGYMENYGSYGNPIGPQDVRELHSFEGQSIEYIARNGTKNLMRFGFEFLSLDGLPSISIVNKAQTLIRALPEKIVSRLDIDLGISEATRVPFNIHKLPVSHEDLSYWGILGFGLVWIVVFLSVVGAIKSTGIRVLSLAAVLFLFFQAYAGPYDPWRGRYFTAAAVFALPTVGVCLSTKNQLIRAYLLLITLLGCVSAISAVVLRTNDQLISINDNNTTSIFSMDRIAQLTSNGPMYYEPLQRFDQLVPKYATVAVFLYEDSFEYPLFGEHLTRIILPINPFDKGLQPIPINAEYLLYAHGFPCADIQEDMHLGADWYLRRLTDNNRECP
jgi:hypothetical protein